MAIYRLQVAWGADSAFPRDRIMINPHFENTGGVLTDSDADQLCEDLADALVAWTSGTREITVKSYDAQGTAPVFPNGSAIRNVGLFPASQQPRELACCLSYYSGNNVPRRRGRLYIPCPFIMGGAGVSVRPTTPVMQKSADLAAIFGDLGGVDVDWVVYSRVDDDARPVSHWWVDNEWDVIRSRGLRGEARLTGTLSE